LRKKTERRVIFAELVRTATLKTAYTTKSDIAINGSQIFITMPSTSGRGLQALFRLTGKTRGVLETYGVLPRAKAGKPTFARGFTVDWPGLGGIWTVMADLSAL
jgi:hypothetical protein